MSIENDSRMIKGFYAYNRIRHLLQTNKWTTDEEGFFVLEGINTEDRALAANEHYLSMHVGLDEHSGGKFWISLHVSDDESPGGNGVICAFEAFYEEINDDILKEIEAIIVNPILGMTFIKAQRGFHGITD